MGMMKTSVGLAAAAAAVAVGNALQYPAGEKPLELSEFGASGNARWVHNSGYDPSLDTVKLTITKPGEYKVSVRHGDVEMAAGETFVIPEMPGFVELRGITPRATSLGMAGLPNFSAGVAWANQPNEFVLVVSQLGSDGTWSEVRAPF